MKLTLRSRLHIYKLSLKFPHTVMNLHKLLLKLHLYRKNTKNIMNCSFHQNCKVLRVDVSSTYREYLKNMNWIWIFTVEYIISYNNAKKDPLSVFLSSSSTFSYSSRSPGTSVQPFFLHWTLSVRSFSNFSILWRKSYWYIFLSPYFVVMLGFIYCNVFLSFCPTTVHLQWKLSVWTLRIKCGITLSS